MQRAHEHHIIWIAPCAHIGRNLAMVPPINIGEAVIMRDHRAGQSQRAYFRKFPIGFFLGIHVPINATMKGDSGRGVFISPPQFQQLICDRAGLGDIVTGYGIIVINAKPRDEFRMPISPTPKGATGGV